MNRLLEKLERSIGKYSVRRLTTVMISLVIAGYVIMLANSNFAEYMALNPHAVLHGQIWRIVTWLLIPPSELNFFTIIMLFFYWSIGSSLERAWGDFRYNVYIFGGILISVIAAFVSYFVFSSLYGSPAEIGMVCGRFFSTYYICMSILLAYASTFPDAVVLLMFVIPVRMKIFGWIYAAYMLYDAVSYIRQAVSTGTFLYLIPVVAMAASLINYAIFFFTMKNRVYLNAEQKRRRREFQQAVRNAERMRAASAGAAYRRGSGDEKIVDFRPSRHRCEVCGRTEVTNPELEFRYCSKCEGAHEYCMDHLYAHIHVGEKDIVDVPASKIKEIPEDR